MPDSRDARAIGGERAPKTPWEHDVGPSVRPPGPDRAQQLAAGALAPTESRLTCRLDVRDPPGARVEVEGELDISTAPEVERALHEAGLQARPVLLDLSAVAFIDCSGLRIILEANLRAVGGLGLQTSPAVERLLLAAGIRDALAVEGERPAPTGNRPA